MSRHFLLLLSMAALSLMAEIAQAADEDVFLGQLRPPSEQAMGQGRTALWTLPLVATQYQPHQITPPMQDALRAQNEGRFLDALIRLDDASKSAQADADVKAGIDLLRASFLLQGNQSQQALEILTPVLAKTNYAADAYALIAMVYLQQGRMQQALEAAQQARDAGGGVLPHLALSYALQGAGRLTEANAVMHGFNARTPQAITLAREAELALTLAQVQAAKTLVGQAESKDGTQPYVIAVGGLEHLIDGQAKEAKAAFEKALQRDPKDAKALLGLGLAEIKLGDFHDGQKKLQAANESNPGNALILTYLGRAQQQAGQTAAAKESWRSAQQADPKDPTPWLYQAQAELQANRPLEARESLRQAQARTKNRAVYRGANLLREDEQLLQANLAEIQRRLGQGNLAFHTLDDVPGETGSAMLRNQADLLQGVRFGESARRSLLLQSLFGEQPGNLPAELDVYGDGAGHTGANTPQHGAVSSLNAQQASYNNYDELFNQRTALEADAIAGSKNTGGEQVRLGAGNDTLGLGVAQRQYKSDGFAAFQNLDNRIGQAIVQWRPAQSMQVFASYQTFNSKHGEIYAPADPIWTGVVHQYEDNSSIARLGLRHSLTDTSELRVLLSRQQTSQTDNWQWESDLLPPPNGTVPAPGTSFGTNYNHSEARSLELQYRRRGADHAWQWGVSAARSPLFMPSLFGTLPLTNSAQQIYADWQQTLAPHWQLQAGLAWGRNDRFFSIPNLNIDTHLRRWLPKLGLVYAPDSATHVRLAAWKHLSDAAVGDAALAPATLVGVVLQRHGDNYKLVRGLALGADRQLGAAWLLEGQTQRRWTDSPFLNGGAQVNSLQGIDESRLALHWQPGAMQVTLAYDDEHLHNSLSGLAPDSVQEQHLRSQQLGLRWLASSQWTANLEWSHNLLAATQKSSDIVGNPILLDVRDGFNQTGVSLNWQFKRTGSLDIGVRNTGNRSLQYTETDPLLPRFSKGRLWYSKLKLAL